MRYRLVPIDHKNTWEVQKGTEFLFWTIWSSIGHFDGFRYPEDWRSWTLVYSIKEGEDKINKLRSAAQSLRDRDAKEAKEAKEFKKNNKIKYY